MVEKKKKDILQAAEYLFATKGFAETTVEDIAEKSGVHEASIFSYFNNKRNILFAIYGGYLKTANIDLNEHFQGLQETGPKLRKLIWHFLSRIKISPHYGRLLLLGQRDHPDFYATEHGHYLKENYTIVLSLAMSGQEEGLFRPDVSPDLIRNMTLGTTLFTIFDSIVHHHDNDPEVMSDIIYRLIINALRLDNEAQLWKQRVERRKAQIVEAANQAFSKRGFLNATVSEIAKGANLAYATIYDYFEGKEAILMGISEMFQQELLTGEITFLRDLTKAEKGLRRLIWRYVSQLWIYEDFARVLTLELYRNMNYYTSPGYKCLEEFLEQIRKAVHQGQQEGIFLKDVPFPTYFHMIIGTLDQFLVFKYLRNSPRLSLAELNGIVDSLVRAIRVPEES